MKIQEGIMGVLSKSGRKKRRKAARKAKRVTRKYSTTRGKKQ